MRLALRSGLLATFLLTVVGVSASPASPVTWQFDGHNSVTFVGELGPPSPVTSGPFTITVTFDPDTPGLPVGCNPTQYVWHLLGATLTWGGMSYQINPFNGVVQTNEMYAEGYCGDWTQIGFVASDDLSGFWVGLLFYDPDVVGNDHAPRDPSHVVPLYAEFNWGAFPPRGPFAQAIGTFNVPTAIPEPVTLLLLGTGLAAVAVRRPRRPT